MAEDKQLKTITFEGVRRKCELDQALNAKEFAVVAGISYTIARELFHEPGFPAINGIVFWSDFVLWRRNRLGIKTSGDNPNSHSSNSPICDGFDDGQITSLPSKALRILDEL